MDSIDQIKTLRDKLKEAENIKCTCTGFQLQYEQGCFCERGISIKQAQAELNNFINDLK